MSIFVRVEFGSPQEFVATFGQALDDLMAVAVQGSGVEQVEDPRLMRFRGFFGPPPTAEENERRLRAWRSMSREEQASYGATARWDLSNVLHLLEPSMREWRTGQLEVTGPQTVAIRLQGDEMGASRGVIRQVVEFAGGRLLDDPDPVRKSSWAFWRERGGVGCAR